MKMESGDEQDRGMQRRVVGLLLLPRQDDNYMTLSYCT